MACYVCESTTGHTDNCSRNPIQKIADPGPVTPPPLAGAGYRTQQARDAYDIAHDPNRAKLAEDNIIAAAPIIPSASRSLIAPAGIQTLGSDFEFEGELHQLQPSVGKPASLGEFA
jgi:hypothetical protein